MYPLRIVTEQSIVVRTVQSEGQRMEQNIVAQEQSAITRLDKVRADQNARIAALSKQAASAELAAQVIEANSDAVNAAIEAVNAQLATGLDWAALEHLVSEERTAGTRLVHHKYNEMFAM